MSLSILVIPGSLRRESHNRRLAEAMIRLPEAGDARFTVFNIGELPLYDEDQDHDQPEAARRLKALVRAADGVIFATPEYNRSIPGVLKNAIDHASRPHVDSAWKGKPAGVLGITIGPQGTVAAQQHLRNVLGVLDMPVMGLPEVFLSYTDELFAPDGTLASERTRGYLGKWLAAFLAHAAKHKAFAEAATPQ